MPDVTLYNMQGEDIGVLSLPESVFGVQPNVPLMHQAVVTEEANRRQGTADTKTRGEVSGGGKKPWRQKGTGRARQGSTRAPHWRHGGVVFGPHPRNYSKALPTKMRRGALRSALSSKVADGELVAIDAMTVAEIGTKQIVQALGKLPLTREVRTRHWDKEGLVEGTRREPASVLVIVPEHDRNLLLSCRNIPYVTLRHAPNFSVRDVLVARRVVIAQEAVAKIEEVLTR